MVALIFQMRHGVQTIGAAGMSGNEDQLAFRRARLAPLQEMLDVHRLVVLVDAEEADIQIVARIFEIVGIAAEEGDRFLRSEHQAHVGVLFVAVQMILAAVVEA